jgi:dUTP pyrophosphatase
MKKTVKIKLSDEAKMPFYANNGDVGADLTATSVEIIMVNKEPVLMYGTGICIEPPEGYCFDLRPRSSIGTKTNLFLTNSIGTVDEGYRGELKFCFGLRGFIMPNVNEPIHAQINREDELAIFYGYDPESTKEFKIYKIGDRIGQILLKKNEHIDEFEQVNFFSETERGEAGYGSSGK